MTDSMNELERATDAVIQAGLDFQAEYWAEHGGDYLQPPMKREYARALAIAAMTPTPQVVVDFRAIIREFTEYAKPTGNPDSDMTPDDWEVGLATFLARAMHPTPQVVETVEALDAVRTHVFEALGAASVCWEETPSGVFDPTQAKAVGDELMTYLTPLIAPTPNVDVLAEVRVAQAAECPGPHGDHQFRLRVNAILDREAGR